MAQPVVTCLDMEGVLFPEIWLAVAEQTGIEELLKTTRDIPDYDELMKQRLAVLRRHSITLKDIQQVVKGLHPLKGVKEFLTWLRERCQVIILSDTYYEFVGPLMSQIQYPTIFCHTLEVDHQGFLTQYFLRQQDQKRQTVRALKNLGFRVLAAGDSYNDISMLQEADAGILFQPPISIQKEFPQLPIAQTYQALQEILFQKGVFPYQGESS